MKFSQLHLRNFRNLEERVLPIRPGLNVFRGQNGQGKTNLIEAVHLLTMGKSFRTSLVEEMVNKSQNQGFFLSAQLLKNDLPFDVHFLVDGARKHIVVNNKRWSANRLRQQFQSVLFSPESLLIVKESSQRRRDLVDELAASLYPGFQQVVFDYERLLRHKKALMKQIREELIPARQFEILLKQVTDQLFSKGATLTFYRLSALEEVEPLLLQEFLSIMDQHYGNLGMDYIISGEKVVDKDRSSILNAMYKRWDELKAREVATGQCLVGPHKHDIDFVFNGEKARFFCSQGQQRAIILAFKLAQIKLHYRAHKVFPVLLLDDVLSELDREKQMRFVNYLFSTRAQILLTTTDATPLDGIAPEVVYEVESGRFEECNPSAMGGLSV